MAELPRLNGIIKALEEGQVSGAEGWRAEAPIPETSPLPDTPWSGTPGTSDGR